MKYTRYFDWKDSANFEPGWIMRGMPNFDPIGSLGMAHDVLEHLTPNDDSMEAEMRAFGVIVWGRGMSGWFYRANSRYTVAATLSHDLCEFIRNHYLGGETLHEAPPGRGRKRLDDDDAERILFDVFRETLKATRRSAPDYMDDDEEIADLRHYAAGFMRTAMPWMRMGFRQAERRYRDSNPDEFTWMFEQLESEFRNTAYTGEFGEILRVTVDTRAMRCTIARGYTDDYGRDHFPRSRY